MSQGLRQHDRRILVAEDNPALAAVVRFHLERVGLQVEVARNGREAWKLLEDGDFALVITDQQMPDVSGCEICRRMRQDPRLAEIPVLMVTAKGLELELSAIAQELGVREVLAKPFSICQLVEAVQECLTSILGDGGLSRVPHPEQTP